MKYIRRIILYLIIVLTHFLLQSTMMLLSVVSNFIFYKNPLWSVGGLLCVVFTALYWIFTFPFVWICHKFSITFPWFNDLPFFLNSLFWGWIIFLIIVSRAKRRHARYHFVRGA